MLDALATSRRIRDEYARYLRSTFSLRDPLLRADFEAALDLHYPLARGPFLQASPPYVGGSTVAELVAEGLLSQEFSKLGGSFPLDRPLYRHQEEAIRKAQNRRNLVIATGTGSGKTESFLFPILDHLLRERDQGTLGSPGVRALLLYPMNALANDQLKRLRGLLADMPEITFGRYVGETAPAQRRALDDFRQRNGGADPLPNELLSREVMQQRPPHILLTNFAMLEYLLLRPADSSFFDGVSAGRWRFVVLDEVHVYNGAKGTEIAMLLRRVRDRVVTSEAGRLQCFATSATLGRGEVDNPALVSFAEALFAEPFEWASSDPERQDVVSAARRPLAQSDATHRLDDEVLGELHRLYRDGAEATAVAGYLAGRSPTSAASEASELGAVLAEALEGDERVIALQSALELGACETGALARELFDGDDAEAQLMALIDLCVVARRRPDDAPLVPARYHLFLRSLDGAFVCLHPDHPDGASRVLLQRHEHCPACDEGDARSVIFELGVCRHCGVEYAVGSGRDGRLTLPGPGVPGTQVLLEPEPTDSEDNEDENAVWAGRDDDRTAQAFLCPGCGSLAERDECGCSAGVRRRRVTVVRLEGRDDPSLVHRCPACTRRGRGEVVSRFLTGSDAPVAVIATDLYQEVPPGDGANDVERPGEGRKLLAFSDSRQDAAFFAPYLERTYGRSVERRLIAAAIASANRDEVWAPDLELPLREAALGDLVLDPDASPVQHDAAVRTWLLSEILAMDTRLSLDGTGLAEIGMVMPRGFEPPPALLRLGLSSEEALSLIHLLLGTLRGSGAVVPPEHVDIRSEVFAPRNTSVYVRQSISGAQVLSWLPVRGRNARLDLVARVLTRLGRDDDPAVILTGIWSLLTSDPWAQTLIAESRRDGVAYRLAYARTAFRPGSSDHPPLRCDRCRRIAWRSVRGVCPQYRCDGSLVAIPTPEVLGNHYARRYRSLAPTAMRVQEHTAQWTSAQASVIQDDFVRGNVNVLSCSTTFELGVDVGDVQAVLLRNVPPSPANYVQRAGRAGRRTESAALVVTFAQRRNHDAHYFAVPREMIEGTISPPAIQLDNLPIARRHAHSVAFAAFERAAGEHVTVAEFFLDDDGGPPASDAFVEWLRGKPREVGDALERLVPSSLQDRLGVASWRWVEELATESTSEPTHGWLARAAAEVRGDVHLIEQEIDELASEQRFGEAARFKRLKATVQGRRLLGFLGSRNVLPKYGFPVDVVELDLTGSGDPVAAQLELTRDLRLAISEFASGSRIVAAKQLWEPLGVRTRPDRELPNYGWAICDTCDAFRSGLGFVPPTCDCGATTTSREGEFLVPIWGFIGGRAKESPGDTRPTRRHSTETFFSSYGQEPPPLEPALGGALECRVSRQGRMVVLNGGTYNRGFRVCGTCGRVEEPPTTGKTRSSGHRDIRRPQRNCGGTFQTRQLGHEFLTDLLEIRFPQPMDPNDARSLLAALLESVESVGVSRSDVDGTIAFVGGHSPAIVLFDAVPGGAGHAQHLHSKLEDLLSAAAERVRGCSCGEDTSCYGCLRSYANQYWHEVLSRGAAQELLEATLGLASTSS